MDLNHDLCITKILTIYDLTTATWFRPKPMPRYTNALVYFLKGSITYSFESETLTAKCGDVMILPKNIVYSGLRVCEINRFIVIDFETAAEHELRSLGLPILFPGFPDTCRRFREILRLWEENNLLLCSYATYDRPCAFFYEAREYCAVYSISMEKVKKLLQNDPNFALAVLTQTTRDMLVCQDLLRKTTNHNVSWMVSDLLIVLAARNSHVSGGIRYLNDRFTQNQIAEMLFINRITCLKELHRLESLGLISLQSSYIGIKDMEGLLEYRKRSQEPKQGG